MTPYIDADGARVSRRAFTLVNAVLSDARQAKRYQDRSVSIEQYDGSTTHLAKGGLWNDTTGRAGYGIAKSDTALLRRNLRAIGAKVSTDDADALLMQAEMGSLQCLATTPEQERTKKANRREKARSLGLCIVCCKRPARAGMVTCKPCSEAAAIRDAAARLRRSQPLSLRKDSSK